MLNTKDGLSLSSTAVGAVAKSLEDIARPLSVVRQATEEAVSGLARGTRIRPGPAV